MKVPQLVSPVAPLTREATVRDAEGQTRTLRIPVERALTLYVERHEIVTLMTLGQEPALLVLGYLLNQGLIGSAADVHSITVDWEVQAAAVRLRAGAELAAPLLARRTVTTGCGQGTAFGDWMQSLAPLPEGAAAVVLHEAIIAMLAAMRARPSVHRDAGSVHGTALWRGDEMLVHIEDVGRHNAVDSIAGWMAMRGVEGDGHLLYTTGRLTSEMVLKAVRLRIPVVISRNGVTAMGLELAERLNLTLVGRASGQRYLCYCGTGRIAAR
jgi:FdhD protein